MANERKEPIPPKRRPGEPTLYYRRRISRSLGKGKALKHEGEDFSGWIAKHGEKGILQAYLGWQQRYGAELAGDFQGIDLEQGAALLDESEGINSFTSAIQGTRGKAISMDMVLQYVDSTLRHLEHDGVKVRFKGDFKEWCIEVMTNARSLGKKSEALKKAS